MQQRRQPRRPQLIVPSLAIPGASLFSDGLLPPMLGQQRSVKKKNHTQPYATSGISPRKRVYLKQRVCVRTSHAHEHKPVQMDKMKGEACTSRVGASYICRHTTLIKY